MTRAHGRWGAMSRKSMSACSSACRLMIFSDIVTRASKRRALPHSQLTSPTKTRSHSGSPCAADATCSSFAAEGTQDRRYRNPNCVITQTRLILRELEPPSGRRNDGAQPPQLGHMLRRQLLQAGHPEQPHRPGHPALQDLDRTPHTRLATGHQPIEVGPPDQRAPGAQCDRRHNVGTRHDARIHQDLGLAAELARDRGQQVKRHRGPVSWRPP